MVQTLPSGTGAKVSRPHRVLRSTAAQAPHEVGVGALRGCRAGMTVHLIGGAAVARVPDGDGEVIATGRRRGGRGGEGGEEEGERAQPGEPHGTG